MKLLRMLPPYGTVALAALLLPPLATAQQAPDTDSGQMPAEAAEAWRGIDATSRQFEAAFARQDAAGMAALYTEDGQVLPTGAGVVAGKPAVQAFWQSVFDAGLTRARLETTEVFPAGAEATEVGRYTLWAGDALADEGKYVVVWRRTEDGWRLHRDIFNTSRAAESVAEQ